MTASPTATAAPQILPQRCNRGLAAHLLKVEGGAAKWRSRRQLCGTPQLSSYRAKTEGYCGNSSPTVERLLWNASALAAAAGAALEQRFGGAHL